VPGVEPILIPDVSVDPDAYFAALRTLLGDRDPVRTYAGTGERVRQLCAGLDDAAWQARPVEGEWSAYQLVGHLVDVDLVYAFRWRLALTADRPWYPGYDEQGWARLARPPADALLAGFLGLRGVNVALLRSLGPAELARTARHDELGEEDVALMVQKIAGHDLAHLDQLRRTVESARGSRG
jgi:DinB family protein